MSKSPKEISALKDHLAKHQLKLTRQREQILDMFLKNEHITAEQMYRQLAEKGSPHRTGDYLSDAQSVLRSRAGAGPPLRHANAVR